MFKTKQKKSSLNQCDHATVQWDMFCCIFVLFLYTEMRPKYVRNIMWFNPRIFVVYPHGKK